MKNCIKCHIEYSDSENYCMECGNKLSGPEHHAKTINKAVKQIGYLSHKITSLESKLDLKIKNHEPKVPRQKLHKITGLENQVKELKGKIRNIEPKLPSDHASKLASLEKRDAELVRGIKNIVTYMKDNETVIENIEAEISSLNKKIKEFKNLKPVSKLKVKPTQVALMGTKIKGVTSKIKLIENQTYRIRSQTNQIPALIEEVRKLKRKIIKPAKMPKSGKLTPDYLSSIDSLEKKNLELSKGIKNILNYISENEETLGNVEKKLNDVILKEDLSTHHKKVAFDTERLLITENSLKKLKSDFNSLLLEIRQIKNRGSKTEGVYIAPLTGLKKRIDAQEEVIANLYQANKKLKASIANNSRKLGRKTIFESVETQRLRKHLTQQDKIINKLLQDHKTKIDSITLITQKAANKIKDESSQYLENLNARISRNIKKNSRGISNLEKRISLIKENYIDVNKTAMESILRRLIKDEKVINSKINSVISKNKAAIVREMEKATKVELDRLGTIRRSLETSIDKEYEKFNLLRKEARLTTLAELKKIENIKNTIKPTLDKELKEIKGAKQKISAYIKNVEGSLDSLESKVTREIKKVSGKVDIMLEKEIGEKITSLENLKKDIDAKLKAPKTMIKSSENRLSKEIINLAQKLNSLSEVQESQKSEILNLITSMKADPKDIQKIKDEFSKKLDSIQNLQQSQKADILKSVDSRLGNNKMSKVEIIKKDIESIKTSKENLRRDIEKRFEDVYKNLENYSSSLRNIPTKSDIDKAIKFNNENVINNMEDHVKRGVIKAVENYAKSYLITQINDLKSRINEIEKYKIEVSKELKKQLVNEALNEIEGELS